MKRFEPQCYDTHDGGTICRMDEYAKGEWVRHADAEAEVEKWKRVAVWAVKELGDEYALEHHGINPNANADEVLAALATAAGEE